MTRVRLTGRGHALAGVLAGAGLGVAVYGLAYAVGAHDWARGTRDGAPVPSVVQLWEDGSGQLSDGQTFCLYGQGCDDRPDGPAVCALVTELATLE